MKAGRQRNRQGDGRQAWRHETERQGDMKTGRKGDKRERERQEAGREMGDRHAVVRQACSIETGMES